MGSWNLEFLHLFSPARSCFDLSFSSLSRYCRTRWITLLALFKFKRSAIHSCRTVVRSLIDLEKGDS